MQASQRCTRRLTSTHYCYCHIPRQVQLALLSSPLLLGVPVSLSIFYRRFHRSETNQPVLPSLTKKLALYNARCKTTRPTILKPVREGWSCTVAKATCQSIYAASSLCRKCHIIIITKKKEITTTPTGQSTHNKITIIRSMTGSSPSIPSTTNNDNERPYPLSRQQPRSHPPSGIHNPSSKSDNYEPLQPNVAYRL